MGKGPIAGVVRQIRSWVGPEPSTATDRQLLEGFNARRDESAFSIIVERHGPLVLGVCQRILQNRHDAEDVFQATFLVLAHKAAAIRWQESVGAWLYEVASRLALKARAERRRQRFEERQGVMSPSADGVAVAANRELQTVLDEELRRLPEKYRLPLVLCCLEDVGRSAAAEQLGWREGTVAGRLARARDLLQRRLARRGIVLSSSAVLTTLPEKLASAAVPPSLGADTVAAALPFALGQAAGTGLVSAQALILSEGLLHTLFLAKCKLMLSMVLAAGLLAAGAMVWSGREAHPPSLAEPQDPAGETPADSPPFFVAAGNAGAEAEPMRVPPERIHAAIASGLKWIVRHQSLEGHWSLDQFHQDGRCNCTEPGAWQSNNAATALALLALTGAGESHKGTEGLYAKSVERGLRFLITRQVVDGSFGEGLTAHGLATLACCRVYRKTNDPALKGPAQRAINYVVISQDVAGGWPERPRAPADLPTTLWQILAIKEAQLAGLNVPNATLKAAGQFLDSLASADGTQYPRSAKEKATAGASAAGLWARQTLLGNAPLARAAPLLAKQPPAPNTKDMFYYFCATQVMDGAGKEHWQSWAPRLTRLLLESQDQGLAADHKDQKGSWPAAGDTQGETGGRLLISSLAVLTLQVGLTKTTKSPELPAEVPPPGQLSSWWDDLASMDFAKTRQGIWGLAGVPEQAVPFLDERLRPVAALNADPQRIDKWIACLESKEFAERQEATAELEKRPEAGPALRKLLDGKPALEVRQRVDWILNQYANAERERSRELQAVEVLVRIGTPQARQVLDKLSKGNPQAPLTTEAKQALEILSKAPSK